MNAEVSVIVVTHKHRSYIERCMDSVEQARSELPLEAFVVDNRSGDGTPEFVSSKYPWARVEVRDRRRGFSDNNNFAIQRSSAPYVLILNPDTQLKPGALSTLHKFMTGTPGAGVAGAKLVFPDGSVQPSYRRFPTLSTALVRRTPLRWFMSDSAINARHLMLDHFSAVPVEVDWLLGACLFARRTAIDQVGLLDEGYYLYVEDIDWCHRMHKQGWKVFWVPDAEIVHHHQAASYRHLFSWHSWLHLKSMARYWKKHLASPLLRAFLGE